MKKATKWVLILVGLIVGVPLIGLVLIVGVIILGYQQSGEPPDFMGYHTDMPLAGSTVAETHVYKGYPKSPKPRSPRYEQIYDSGVQVVQFKGSGRPSNIVCDTISIEPYTYDCKKGDIDKGMYAVTIIYREGKLFNIKVSAHIDGTEMYMIVPEKAQEHIAEYTEWQSYFNSMEPLNLK